MANNSSNPQFEKGRWVDRVTLLRNANGTSQGEWVRLIGPIWSVTVGGTLTAGSVSLLVSNQEAQPTDYNWPPFDNITQLASRLYNAPFVWVAAITTGVTGSVKVDLRVDGGDV